MESKRNCVKPFWSWNDWLKKEELKKQIRAMKESGIEGFFMHARGGLKTEYMSKEWFECIEACLDTADELGMEAWAYDENGWPSGSGDGKVPAAGIQHQQKTLKLFLIENLEDYERSEISKENVIAMFSKTKEGFLKTDTVKTGTYVFYYMVNPYYIDVFQKDTIKLFLKYTHEKYYERFQERFGTSLQGFFTDEPQYRTMPWSFAFLDEFKKMYGYDLLPKLPLLFFNEEGCEAVRNDYLQMVSKLFQESFIKQMYDWCTEHNCKLTGHMINENNLHSQVTTSGGVMACYEYFHEPGMDHLGRYISSPQQPKQLGSVAAQLGRKTLTETFGLCGWDVSPNELKWIAQWQFVNGVTSLCPHLAAYSLRGCRKRDYPPSLFTQMPWFETAYKEFADYFTKLGTVLDSGKDITPFLIIHPIHSAYVLYSPINDKKLLDYSEQFETFTNDLNNEHVLHHYGDETILHHFGSVRTCKGKNGLQVGRCNYEIVLLPDIVNLTDNTVNLLHEFAKAGGKIVAVGNLPKLENGRHSDKLNDLLEYVDSYDNLNEIIKNCNQFMPISISYKDSGENCESIHVSFKELENGEKLLYLVNNKKQEQSIVVRVHGHYGIYFEDILKNQRQRIATKFQDECTVTELKVAEYGSVLLKLCDDQNEYAQAYVKEEKLPLNKIFEIQSVDDNTLTLDYCSYRIDDGEWQSPIAVMNLHNKVLALQKECKVEMKFAFDIVDNICCENICLCMENPERFQILINNEKVDFLDEGAWIDQSIRKCNVGNYIQPGKNEITLICHFHQSQELYDAKFTPGVHESVLNKLTYDTELESIYLTGAFGVQMEEDFRYGERRCIHGGKKFTIGKAIREIDITDVTHQGFWFFRGQISLMQKCYVNIQPDRRYLLSLKKLNAPAAKVLINDVNAGSFIFAPYELDVTKLLCNGENKVTIQLLSGNRNVFGPHHKPEGESYSVGPDSFSDKHGWTDNKNLPPWTDNYNFVMFGCEIQ